MTRIRWTPLALQDLKDISGYIENQTSLAAANHVCRLIYQAVQFLRRFPDSGKPGLEEGTREWVVPPLTSYIVVYRSVPSDIVHVVEVLRIWHAAQHRQSAMSAPAKHS